MLILLLLGMLTLAPNIQQVKSMPMLLLMTDKNTYSLGEDVVISLCNVGTETVYIGGYPPWKIFTYPEMELVCPKYFATLYWWLDPGERDNFTWNQYNEFTESFVGPGKYVVEDHYGWGLAAIFTITETPSPPPPPPTPVGGYSIPTQVNRAEKSTTFYIASLATLAVSFTILKRKAHRRKDPN